jgi:hypothetical protein
MLSFTICEACLIDPSRFGAQIYILMTVYCHSFCLAGYVYEHIINYNEFYIGQVTNTTRLDYLPIGNSCSSTELGCVPRLHLCPDGARL